MGKDLLRPLQICLSKLRGGSKVYEVSCNEEKSSWIFSCKHPRTDSLSRARQGDAARARARARAHSVYKCYNSLYIVSDQGSRALVPLPEEEEEEEEEQEEICHEKSANQRVWCTEEDSDNNIGFSLSSKCSSDSSNFFSDSSSRSSDLPPGLASGLTSERFFFSPGSSNSILEEANSKCSKSVGREGEGEAEEEVGEAEAEREQEEEECSSLLLSREKIDLLVCNNSERWDLVKSRASCYDFSGGIILKGESVAVHMNSPNPYWDFRISMQEMVEAHNLRDWESLQEMLICYLSLNNKRTHSFILGAFADLVAAIINTPLLEAEHAIAIDIAIAD